MAVTPPACVRMRALLNIDQIGSGSVLRHQDAMEVVDLRTRDADVVAEHEATGGRDDAAHPDVPGDPALELPAVGARLGDGKTPGHCCGMDLLSNN